MELGRALESNVQKTPRNCWTCSNKCTVQSLSRRPRVPVPQVYSQGGGTCNKKGRGSAPGTSRSQNSSSVVLQHQKSIFHVSFQETVGLVPQSTRSGLEGCSKGGDVKKPKGLRKSHKNVTNKFPKNRMQNHLV